MDFEIRPIAPEEFEAFAIADGSATAALRGMSPAAYGGVDLVVLVADGTVRQLLQPRSLPWEEQSP